MTPAEEIRKWLDEQGLPNTKYDKLVRIAVDAMDLYCFCWRDGKKTVPCRICDALAHMARVLRGDG